MRFVRDLRLIRSSQSRAAALFLLKVSAIVVEGGYTLIASRAALAQGLGEGQTAKDFELPPPAALDDAAPAPRGDRARSWVRDIYAPEYTGSVAAKPDAAPAPNGAAAPKPPPRLRRTRRSSQPASAPCWRVCSNAARSWKRERAKWTCATACSRPRKSASRCGCRN